jgi:hypothetical protein
MSPDLKVNLSNVRVGWMDLSLVADGGEFSTACSDTPYDSLTQLTDALHTACVDGRAATARLNSDPEEHDLLLEPGRTAEWATLRLVRYPDHARSLGTGAEVFAAEVPMREIGLAFWRALRRLEADLAASPESAWRFEFPHAAVARLGTALRG